MTYPSWRKSAWARRWPYRGQAEANEPYTGLLDTQTIKNASNVTLASFDLGYDKASNVTSKASTVFSNASNATWGYTYDLAGRLTSASGKNAAGQATTSDYAYDGGGNRITARETTGSMVSNVATELDPSARTLEHWENLSQGKGSVCRTRILLTPRSSALKPFGSHGSPARH